MLTRVGYWQVDVKDGEPVEQAPPTVRVDLMWQLSMTTMVWSGGTGVRNQRDDIVIAG